MLQESRSSHLGCLWCLPAHLRSGCIRNRLASYKEEGSALASIGEAGHRRLLFYVPYAKQLGFYKAGAEHRERLLMAANRVGKTPAGGMETAIHLTGRYPAGGPESPRPVGPPPQTLLPPPHIMRKRACPAQYWGGVSGKLTTSGDSA
jgi:hypothetical protein